MKRIEQREWVFKIIFENQLDSIDDIERNFINHELDFKKDTYIYQSLESYIINREDINQILLEELGEHPYKRLSKIDRSILNLSINEIFYLNLPDSISINEAVNISKKYSTEEGYKFINSVLGSIVRKKSK